MLHGRVCSGLRTLKFNESCKNLINTVLLRCSYSTTHAKVNSEKELDPSLLNKINLLLTKKNIRDKNGQTILKNFSLVKQAFEANMKITDIVFKREIKDIPSSALKDVRLHWVSHFQAELNMDFKDRKNGMIAICNIPSTDFEPAVQRSHALPVTLVLDNIRNHENMGIIVSLFEHLQCKKLLLTKGCIDIWNPKTIECSMGSLFKCHWDIRNNQSWDDIQDQLSQNSKLLLADAYDGNEYYSESSQTPVKYTEIDYKSYPEFTLIIGGETEGLSEEARTFCSERSGNSIYIPLKEGVDSLNAGVAASIMLSEITRQLQID